MGLPVHQIIAALEDQMIDLEEEGVDDVQGGPEVEDEEATEVDLIPDLSGLQVELVDSTHEGTKWQNIILQKKNTFLQKQISRTCLEVGLEESKRIFDSDKVWGVRQTILRGGVPKVCSCFPPPCSFKCPHKMPA